MPRLRLVHRTQGSTAFEPFRLLPGVTYIGRVASNDIRLQSELISKRHAKIILTDMGVTVHDLDSHNGVFLNGKKVRSTPLARGDLVYFGDVCCTLEEADGTEQDADEDLFDSGINKSNLVSRAAAQQDLDDPAVRNLATLIRATDLLLNAGDEEFFPEIIQLCRELTDSDLAVLVRREETGDLTTPVVLREGTGPRGDVPVAWRVVQTTIEEQVVQFSRDTSEDPLGGEQGQGAVMCVPIVSGLNAAGALYLGRDQAGIGFTDREVETVSAVAHLVGTRFSAGAGGGKRSGAAPEDADTKVGAPIPVPATREEQTGEELERLQSELEQAQAALQSLAATQQERDALRAKVQQLENAQNQLETKHAETLERMRADMRSVHEEAQPLKAQVKERDLQLVAAKNEIGRLHKEIKKTAATGGIPAEIEKSLPAPVISRLRAVVAGNADVASDARNGIALCVGLSGFDAWAAQQGKTDVEGRFARYASAVLDHATANEGVVEQTLGTQYLIVFPANGEGVKNAVTCATGIVRAVPEAGVQAGIHLGVVIAGFFGPDGNALLGTAGEAVAIARGACEYAHGGTVYVSEAVRSQIPADSGMMLVNIGPHIIRGMPQPVNLYQLAVQEGS